MAYSTFLLDLDHTLFDTEASEVAAFEKTLHAAGIADPAQHLPTYQTINLGLWAAVERGALSAVHIKTLRFERFVEALQLDADPIRMADDFVVGLGEFGGLYDGALEVLEQLSEQATLAMVTNGLGDVQRARIARLGLDRFFDAVAISAEIGAAKPEAGIFDKVFEQLGAAARRGAVMVGDNLSADIAGGENYGLATCWYNPQGREASAAHRIDHEIRDLGELVGLVAV